MRIIDDGSRGWKYWRYIGGARSKWDSTRRLRIQISFIQPMWIKQLTDTTLPANVHQEGMLYERESVSDPLRVEENRIIEVDVGDTPISKSLTGVEQVGDINTCFDNSLFEPKKVDDVV